VYKTGQLPLNIKNINKLYVCSQMYKNIKIIQYNSQRSFSMKNPCYVPSDNKQHKYSAMRDRQE